MRYLLLLSTDFNRSVNSFHPDDLAENLNAAQIVSKCITTEYNSHEWDSSVRFDVNAWTGYELQLFMYGYKMAQALGEADIMVEFEDLIGAYSIDENTAMTRPPWSMQWTILEAHAQYLLGVTQHPDHGNYRALAQGKTQALPVPLHYSYSA